MSARRTGFRFKPNPFLPKTKFVIINTLAMIDAYNPAPVGPSSYRIGIVVAGAIKYAYRKAFFPIPGRDISHCTSRRNAVQLGGGQLLVRHPGRNAREIIKILTINLSNGRL